MFASDVAELRRAVCALAARFDPAELGRDEAESLTREWSAVANAAHAASAMAAARVAECGAPRGSNDAADWFAKTTGTTGAKARDALRAGAVLARQDATRLRATAGSLSFDQTAAITDAVEADPSAEAALLAVAAGSSLGELRDECAKRKAASDPDPAETERRIHRARRLRRWRDGEGAEHLHATGTKTDLAKIDHALKPIIDEIFKARRGDGVREPLDAYAFDALVTLAEQPAERPGAVGANGQPKLRYLGVLRVDWEALVRGTVDDGETCEIAGLGPISVHAARQLLSESILKLVVTKGDAVLNVTHLGRGPNIAQKVALLWQQPRCARAGCGRQARLEYDHREEWRAVHCTELGNLDPLCCPDHDLKTRFGWALVDGTGTRPMVPPDHPDHPGRAGHPGRTGRTDNRRAPPVEEAG